MTDKDLIRQIMLQLMERQRAVETAPPKPREIWAPDELWPGESTDLGGFLLAKGKRGKPKWATVTT